MINLDAPTASVDPSHSFGEIFGSGVDFGNRSTGGHDGFDKGSVH